MGTSDRGSRRLGWKAVLVVGALGLRAAPAALADSVVFAVDTTIGDGNTQYENYDVTVQGCTLTINGAHAFHSVTVERNASNQPGVVTHTAGFTNGTVNGFILTIAGDVSVQGGEGSLVASRIDVAGRGFAPAVGPGAGASAGRNGGGAGYGGNGGDAWTDSGGLGGAAYGAPLTPTDLGSGGGSSDWYGYAVGGAGGGAAQLTVAGTLTLGGALLADGNNGQLVGADNVGGGGGSGGSIVVGVGTFAGAGTVSANGGNGGGAGCSYGGGGGGGRIAIVYAASSFTGMWSAHAGCGYVGGGAGTIYTRATGQPTGIVLVDNNGGPSGALTPLGTTAATVRIANSGAVYLVGASTFAGLDIAAGGLLTHPAGLPSVDLRVEGDATVESGGALSVSGRGFPAAAGPGAGANAGRNGGGAAHGGNGGAANPNEGGAGGDAYDSATAPSLAGSGGGSAQSYWYAVGGAGGGATQVTVTGNLLVNGSIDADGRDGQVNHDNVGGGGGAGGSIQLIASSFGGTGVITARGGRGGGDGAAYGGGGGGGRIAIQYATSNFVGTLSAFGRVGYAGGGAGTIYTKSDGQTVGDLLIDNGGSVGVRTPSLAPDVFGSVTVRNGAEVDLSGAMAFGADALTIDAAGLVDLQTAAHFGAVSILAGGRLGHRIGASGFDLTVDRDMTVATGGTLALAGRGYPRATGPGTGGSAERCGGGAGHGGAGGSGNPDIGGGGAGGAAYDSLLAPSQLGSGGGNALGFSYAIGGAGGGAARLTVASTLTVDGAIVADGTSGQPSNDNVGGGGGAGGTIYLSAGTLTGGGTISANGGDGGGANFGYGGGGAGGRIAIYTCDQQMDPARITAGGGRGFQVGQDGTVMHVSPFITISQQPVGGIAFIGDAKTFTTAASTTHGTLHYQWRRNCVDVANDAHITGATTNTLHINPLACPDAGVYDAWLTDDCGAQVSDAVTLIVPPLGDMDCNGVVDFDDINAFVLALSDESGYEAAFPNCRWLQADCDQNGTVNFDDINYFVAALGSHCP